MRKVSRQYSAGNGRTTHRAIRDVRSEVNAPMFYCDACAHKNGWPDDFWLPRSHGPCEVCGKTASCHDVPSTRLSDNRNRSQSTPSLSDKNYRQMYEALVEIREKAATIKNGGSWAAGLATLCLGTLDQLDIRTGRPLDERGWPLDIMAPEHRKRAEANPAVI